MQPPLTLTLSPKTGRGDLVLRYWKWNLNHTCRTYIPLVPARPGVILEARVVSDEGETYRADGAVTLFADDDFRRAFISAFGVVHFIAIDKEDQVRIKPAS